jgi:hypothetical protein
VKEWKCNNKQNAESIDSVWSGCWGCHLFGRDGNPIAFVADDKIEWKASKEDNNNENWRMTARLDGCIVDFAFAAFVSSSFLMGVTSSGRIVACKTPDESPRIEWDASLLPRDVVGLLFHSLNRCLVFVGWIVTS